MLQPDKKTAVINGQRMAYREIGEGDPIVFAHGNPTPAPTATPICSIGSTCSPCGNTST